MSTASHAQPLVAVGMPITAVVVQLLEPVVKVKTSVSEVVVPIAPEHAPLVNVGAVGAKFNTELEPK